jgi:hypothetical protein
MMHDVKPKLLIVEDDRGLQAQLKWAYDDFDVVIAGDRASAIEQRTSDFVVGHEYSAIVDEGQRHHETAKQPAPKLHQRQDAHDFACSPRRQVLSAMAEGTLEDCPPGREMIAGGFRSAVDKGVPLGRIDLVRHDDRRCWRSRPRRGVRTFRH